MRLTKPKKLCKTPLVLPEGVNLSDLHNGLFRCPLNKVLRYMPELAKILEHPDFPISPEFWHNWEVDVKVHMLMPNQYPCVPNWHCDNVPRPNGFTDYKAVQNADLLAPPMYLYVSGTPCTEFLTEDDEFAGVVESHADVAEYIRLTKAETQLIEPQTWYAMWQNTPHRGTIAKDHSWRLFIRLTHNSIAPVRPVTDVIRRHSQVYLDATNFSW